MSATSRRTSTVRRRGHDGGVTEVGFKGVDGLRLAGDRFAPEGRAEPSEEGPSVVFLHGGGQTRHSWGGTARQVAARGLTAYTLDARGHGDSDWAPDGDYRLVRFAGEDPVELLQQFADEVRLPTA